MKELLYFIVSVITRIHNSIMGLNDSVEYSFTDKELHFLVIGVLGILMLFVIHPLFNWLSRTGHTMVISFFYVFTVIVVITFAIEIGQRVTGTGNMEFADIAYGVFGFLIMFAVFAVIRAAVHLIRDHMQKSRNGGEAQ